MYNESMMCQFKIFSLVLTPILENACPNWVVSAYLLGRVSELSRFRLRSLEAQRVKTHWSYVKVNHGRKLSECEIAYTSEHRAKCTQHGYYDFSSEAWTLKLESSWPRQMTFRPVRDQEHRIAEAVDSVWSSSLLFYLSWNWKSQ